MLRRQEVRDGYREQRYFRRYNANEALLRRVVSASPTSSKCGNLTQQGTSGKDREDEFFDYVGIGQVERVSTAQVPESLALDS